MSQAGILDVESSNPQIPTQFDADTGSAIPLVNVLEILGGTGIETSASGNTVTIDFNGTSGVASINVDANTAPGTDPVLPDGSGIIAITGAQVATGIIGANVIRTDSLAANSLTIEIQRSTAVAATDSTKNGVSHFDSGVFSVDANGFVTTSLTGVAKTITGDTGGALSPAAGNWNLLGSGSITTAGAGSTLTTQLTGLTNHAVLVGAGTSTITKVGPSATAGQILQSAGAAADPAFSTATYPSTTTVSQILYSSSANVVTGLATANRAVLTTTAAGVPVMTALTDGQLIIGSTAGAPAAATLTEGTGIDILNGSNSITISFDATEVPSIATSYTTDSGSAIPALGVLTVAGGAGIDTSGAGSTVTVTFDVTEVPTLPTSIGTDSGTVTPALNTFSVVGGTGMDTSGAGTTLTVSFDVTEIPTIANSYAADSGTAAPAANVITIAGGPGVTTSATGSTVTINSVVFTNTAAATLAVDNGYFCTAAGTYPLPATAAQGEMLIVVCDTSGAVVLDAPASNFIRIGSLISSSGGTATSTQIGDSLTLRYRLSTLTWECTSCIGTWALA